MSSEGTVDVEGIRMWLLPEWNPSSVDPTSRKDTSAVLLWSVVEEEADWQTHPTKRKNHRCAATMTAYILIVVLITCTLIEFMFFFPLSFFVYTMRV